MTEVWQDRALCDGADPEIFFTGGEARNAYSIARKWCALCPVVTECGEYAITNNIQYGMWGGMSEAERQRVAARGRYAAFDGQPHGDKAGTVAGYYRERRAKVDPCDPCRDAYNTHQRLKDAQRKAISCGNLA